MPIWFTPATPEALNQFSQNTLVSHLGIEFTEVGEDYLAARMPVDERTFQPARILHGGANVALAETLGSTAANLALDPAQASAVGLEVNANHLRAMKNGWVTGVARPLHLGGSTQVWEIRICDEKGRLVCITRLTMAVLQRR